MDECIFCKIVSGEIPSTKVYEDELFFGFLDVNTVTKGHTLLIPKLHSQWMHGTEDYVVGKIFITAKKLMNKMREEMHCDYIQISVVGEEIPHFHVHLIPRYFGVKITI
jgi:histidine triad (HIT) family protein